MLFRSPETWYEAAHADFKKPPGEVDLGELLPIALEVNDAISHTAKWMKPVRVPTPLVMAGTSGHLKYEPKGRCLILSPWNYPVTLTFVPLVSAIAAGNTAMLKPSEMTPNLSAAMAKLVKDVFPEDEVALFEGDASTAQALLDRKMTHLVAVEPQLIVTGNPGCILQLRQGVAQYGLAIDVRHPVEVLARAYHMPADDAREIPA